MKKAIVLGGTSPHVELIQKLKNRGYAVTLIDYLENPPGAAVANKHVRESTLDMEKVLRIAREEQADLVISTCIDQANSVCCYVAEQLSLPKPYSYQTSLDVTDKGLMKRIFVKNEIPTSNYQTVDKIEDVDWDEVYYPAVVKPVDCNSSKGVHRVDSREEAEKYLAEDFELSRTGCAIIEGFNQGEEIQVDCFATECGAEVLMTRQKKKIRKGNDMVLQSTGSIIPAPLTSMLQIQAKEIAGKIAEAFDLHNTPFFYQAIVTEQGISVLEFAPRIGGGLSYYLLKEIAGVDAVELAIDSFLGKRNNVKPNIIDGFYSTNLLYVKPGTFDHLAGVEELKNDGTILEYFQMKKPGTVIDADIRSGNRVGAFIVSGRDYEELLLLEDKAYKRIRALSPAGENILNTDLRI